MFVYFWGKEALSIDILSVEHHKVLTFIGTRRVRALSACHGVARAVRIRPATQGSFQ